MIGVLGHCSTLHSISAECIVPQNFSCYTNTNFSSWLQWTFSLSIDRITMKDAVVASLIILTAVNTTSSFLGTPRTAEGTSQNQKDNSS